MSATATPLALFPSAVSFGDLLTLLLCFFVAELSRDLRLSNHPIEITTDSGIPQDQPERVSAGTPLALSRGDEPVDLARGSRRAPTRIPVMRSAEEGENLLTSEQIQQVTEALGASEGVTSLHVTWCEEVVPEVMVGQWRALHRQLIGAGVARRLMGFRWGGCQSGTDVLGPVAEIVIGE